MNNHLINIEINGKKIQIRQGAMLIEAADEAGIEIRIPRFCYHKKLSIAANCRMCLVQVEKAPKPLPACATPVSEGMKVFTMSQVTQDAQKAVMEFLLINHPLDCPICDQGGECELQDVALEYGVDKGIYDQPKRVIKDKDIGPLISTEMTRCIHCTRCVRFGDEIAGMRELGATGRGEHMEIGTYLEHNLDSELSGNIIDLCPVGALTSKPFRFKARAWELYSRASVATHDCVGSNIFVHTFRNKVLRVIPRENEAINETWLSDRDRFSYESMNHPDRLLSPKIKKEGQWQDVSWPDALEAVRHCLKTTQPDKLGALISPSSTVEEGYVLQKLLRSLGSSNIDHRVHTADMSDQDYLGSCPVLGRTIESLETCDIVFILGGHLKKEQPMVNHRLRKGVRNHNTKILTLIDYDMDWNFEVTYQGVVQSGDYITPLLGLVKILSLDTDYIPDANTKKLAEYLLNGQNKAILLGSQILSHPKLHIIRYLAHQIAQLIESTVGELPIGSNTTGAWLAGALPHRGPVNELLKQSEKHSGLSAMEMLKKPLDTYLLVNLEPEYDCLNPKEAITTLKSAKTVISMTPYVTQAMLEYAHILLPITPLYESAGTIVNIESAWQSVEPASAPAGLAWPSWKILNTLGNLLNFEQFHYTTSSAILRDIKPSIENYNTQNDSTVLEQNIAKQLANLDINAQSSTLTLLSPMASFATDNITRRAVSLQKTNEAKEASLIRIHPNTVEHLQLNPHRQVQLIQDGIPSEGNFSIRCDQRIPENSVFLSRGLINTSDLGVPYRSVKLVKYENII